jgi:DnaK suppressor protein
METHTRRFRNFGALSLNQIAGYNPLPTFFESFCRSAALKQLTMNADKLQHYKKLLLAELRRHARHVGEDQAAAIDAADDGAKESADVALRGVIQDLALKLGDQESQMVADIDQALLRIDEGSYGICVRCGKPIEERRLEALPTARYDAACQAAIEETKGTNARPTL